MGLAASQSRFLDLTVRKSNIELNGQQINQQRMVLSSMTKQYSEQMSKLMNDTNFNGYTFVANSGANAGKLAATGAGAAGTVVTDYNNLIDKITQIQGQDKLLEMELKDVDTQHNEVQTEIDSVKKVIDKNIDMTFKTFA